MKPKSKPEWWDRRLAFHGYSIACIAVLSYALLRHPMAAEGAVVARISTTMIDAWLWAFLGYTGSRVAEKKLGGLTDGRRDNVEKRQAG